MTFLHRLKKILAINYKKAKCYDNAWLFFFKVSHHTSLSVNYSGRSLNFRLLRYRSVKQAQIRREGCIFRNLPPSRLVCYWGVLSTQCPGIPISFCKLHETLCNKSIREFRKEKINTLDHYPTPYPPLPAVRSACSDCRLSRLTIQLV